MARMIPNSFTTYELSLEEERSGKILNSTQKQVLNNIMAEKAAGRLGLELDLLNPGSFLQQEAYLKGQIELIQYILEISDLEESAIREEAEVSRNN